MAKLRIFRSSYLALLLVLCAATLDILATSPSSPHSYRIQAVQFNGVTGILSYQMETGTVAGGKFHTRRKDRYSIDFSNATMLKNNKRPLSFSEEERVRVDRVLQALMQYSFESAMWYEAGGPPVEPSRPPIRGGN